MPALRFVLVGYGCELSLRPLATALATRGERVAIVDLAVAPLTPAAVPEGQGPVVLVTSQHLSMTGPVYDEYVGVTSHYASPFELRRRIAADLLVYVPHDLTDPVLPWEVPTLRGFDLYVAPDHGTWWASAHVETVVAGWAGFAWSEPERLAGAAIDDGVLFISAIRWMAQRGGIDWLLEAMPRTLHSGVGVKLPLWPGMDHWQARLEAAGVPTVDPALSTCDVIRHTPLVVTNAPSSILAESILAGHVPVCVLHPDARDDFSGELGVVDAVLSTDEGFPTARSAAGRVRADCSGFDATLFLDAVRRRVGSAATDDGGRTP